MGWLGIVLYRVVCRVSCVVCRVSCVVCRVSCVVCRVSCVVCRVSCVVSRLTSYKFSLVLTFYNRVVTVCCPLRTPIGIT